MSSDPSQRRPGSPPDDDEQELDLGRYWHAVTLRWWLVLGAVVVGAAVGYLTTLNGGKTYRAEAIVYLGTPFGPDFTSTTPVTTPGYQLAALNQIALAESTIRQVAAQLRMNPNELRGKVETKGVPSVATAGKPGAPAPIADIIVTGSQPKATAAVANAIAEIVARSFSAYSNEKIKTLEQEDTFVRQRIVAVNKQLATALAEKQIILSLNTDPASKLLAIENYNSTINAAEDRQIGLVRATFVNEKSLSLAQEYEQGRLLTHAVSTGQVTRSRSNSVIVGAIIGLLIGIVAALLWAPAERRLRTTPG